MLVGQRKKWVASFTSPMGFAPYPFELLKVPGGRDHTWIGGDVSGSDGGGIVATTNHEVRAWHAEHMGVFAGALGRVCGSEETNDMTAADFPIFVEKLMALAALVVQHGHRWTNRTVCAA